jgi:hypothetical protein
VVLEGESGAGGQGRELAALRAPERALAPAAAGPEHQHPHEAAAREQRNEYSLPAARRRLDERAVGEEEARVRDRRELARLEQLARPSGRQDLERFELPVPEEQRRVRDLQRARQLAGEQAAERLEVGDLQRAVGEPAQAGGVRREAALV